jgi:two-component system heavy metal sensor histidine kinase CusS
VSRFVFRRVSRLLHEVANTARSVRPLHEPVSLELREAPKEIRELVDALRETLQRIQHEAEETRVFTAGMAHELRSPVQNLVGETEVALIAPRDAETYRNVLASHLDELRRLGDAIDNLVTICSTNETRRTVEREDFDLAQEAEIRMRRERSLAQHHGLDLTLRVTGDTRIHGDREAILRALRNLVQNAIQWSPAGGRIDVEIAGLEREIAITVDDAGPGVPVDLRERIFEPFFRGPAAQGRRIGYGLGLALTRAAAIDQGGEVRVEVSPLGGARMSLHLPKKVGSLRAAS